MWQNALNRSVDTYSSSGTNNASDNQKHKILLYRKIYTLYSILLIFCIIIAISTFICRNWEGSCVERESKGKCPLLELHYIHVRGRQPVPHFIQMCLLKCLKFVETLMMIGHLSLQYVSDHYTRLDSCFKAFNFRKPRPTVIIIFINPQVTLLLTSTAVYICVSWWCQTYISVFHYGSACFSIMDLAFHLSNYLPCLLYHMHDNNDFFICGLNSGVGKDGCVSHMLWLIICAVKSFSHHFTTQPSEYKHFDME